ncbi:hypothetical protein MNEG_10738 [Monoraphidium neglectum]|uniref:Fungal lipase-type domain-containing protein n=1 Tax=Monoraphidium neglectum TaxID=145388 RepID=A0A0D2KNL8_9CHLO|nr:hypothetical protein MNEG_10738 [Monoraphidium neglectum]KIY97223.1 hypothetical protein MNEG_10738 [Monoraphidium neglectum]|eukprot:XP_013896243.1 hypothetical protein MNEG_10738 [Monoraphidium neglectum]
MHDSPAGAPVDITAFLRPVQSHDLKQLRMLASLCGLTYYMGTQVTPRSLLQRHRLDLVSTSLACERIAYEHQAGAREVVEEGDGCCISAADAAAIYADRDSCMDAAAADVGAAAANIVPFSRSLVGASVQQNQQRRRQAAAAAAAAVTSGGAPVLLAPAAAASSSSSSDSDGDDVGGSSKPNGSGGWKPADLVAAKLGEAAAAASAAALAPLAPLASAASAASAAALAPLASAAGSLYAGGLGLVSSRLLPTAAQLPLPLPLPERLAGAAIAGIAGMEVAASHPNGGEVKAASTSPAACPSEWFVADDPRGHTRYFVIQGSDSLDHWKTNLMFEPVPFEGEELGIKVHRGAYEAACALYDRFLPLVQEQVHSHALARVAFTGHSIGGSMATLLALMFRHRGVLRADQLAPTVTFGSPAILCARARGSRGGGSGSGACGSACSGCAAPCARNGGGAGCGCGGGLLERLGLAEGAVRNVIMTRDIVPRAFACDYSLVADILRSWGPQWRWAPGWTTTA